MMWLRWILLGVGALFMIGVFAWERRRSRQAAAQDAGWRGGAEASTSTTGRFDAPGVHAEAAQRREPVLPELDELPDPLQRLPVMEVAASTELQIDMPVIDAMAPPFEAARPAPIAREPEPPTAPLALVVDWPPESERRILSLRITCRSDERLSGRAVRQSLEAFGFMHGRFGIYHQPGPDGRAVLSAASLSRPGILDPENMDFLSYSGLSLFAVLPGPLAPQVCLDQLVSVGHLLADRLHARLQTDRGATLDEVALSQLRSEAGGIGSGA
ncbi:MAG: cell division protein ZipA C-terminal FtsZ-binding domain-containing protein [Steroidobacteraceae bacterium]